MQDGVFDLMNWWLVFWEVVALAVVVFLIVFFVLAVRFLIRANRGDSVAAHRVLDERYVSGEFDRGEYEQGPPGPRGSRIVSKPQGAAHLSQRPYRVISCHSVTKPVSRSTCNARYSISSSLNSMTAPHSRHRAWWCIRSVESS